ncbi:Magnesium transporter ALR2 [Spathaspora sp. JA1]|nr:Magnesium transporter ALR2 [Spathaspora sp. JA1]
MSDTESFHSNTHHMPKTDDVLDDHRNHLPITQHQPSLTSQQAPTVEIEPHRGSSVAISDSEDEETIPAAALRANAAPPKRKLSKTGPSRSSQSQGNPTSSKPTYMSSLRRDFYLNEEDSSNPSPPILKSSSIRRKSRAHSNAHNIDEASSSSPPPGILYKPKKQHLAVNSPSDAFASDLVSPLTKCKTTDSDVSHTRGGPGVRRLSRSSIDSEADSHASRSSQETEEDVCFPMSREHIRINGIDFDEIEEFIKEEQELAQSMRIDHKDSRHFSTATGTGASTQQSQQKRSSLSSASMKYTPKNILKKTQTTLTKIKTHWEEQHPSSSSSDPDRDIYYNVDEKDPHVFDDSSSDQVRFGGVKISDRSTASLPQRFSFFHSDSDETVHAADIPSLVAPGQSVCDLFKNGEETWWLDCSCPTDAEMKVLAKAFGIHPLTAEDIRMQETREKVELFRSYYFVCFHTFEQDKESEDYLEPINVYLVVFREGILTFHFSPISHPASVRRRVRQLRDYVDVSADWLCYALIDDITDGFAPVITSIEYEADAIEDFVFVARDSDFSNMLQRIGESRRKVMTLMRLLSGKADVIKMFAKRCQDEVQLAQSQPQSQLSPTQSFSGYPVGFNQGGTGGVSFGPGPAPLNQSIPSHTGSTPPGGSGTGVGGGNGVNSSGINITAGNNANITGNARPRADIALYLGDIQDHVVTMFQNLLSYEKIFSRSHSNYLAQLQVKSFNANNKITEMFSKVTLIGTMLVPLNLITGLFGMNVKVPGQDAENLGWWFGILGVLVFVIMMSFIFARWWIGRLNSKTSGGEYNNVVLSARKSIKSLGLRRNRGKDARSMVSFPNKYE